MSTDRGWELHTTAPLGEGGAALRKSPLCAARLEVVHKARWPLLCSINSPLNALLCQHVHWSSLVGAVNCHSVAWQVLLVHSLLHRRARLLQKRSCQDVLQRMSSAGRLCGPAECGGRRALPAGAPPRAAPPLLLLAPARRVGAVSGNCLHHAQGLSLCSLLYILLQEADLGYMSFVLQQLRMQEHYRSHTIHPLPAQATHLMHAAYYLVLLLHRSSPGRRMHVWHVARGTVDDPHTSAPVQVVEANGSTCAPHSGARILGLRPRQCAQLLISVLDLQLLCVVLQE